MIPADERQARAAYEQFADEPHPAGFHEEYPYWEMLNREARELWFRVATAAINGCPCKA